MRAVFVSTIESDVDSVVGGWNCWNEPAGRVGFDHLKPVDNDRLVREAAALRPEVIFYIGSVSEVGFPSIEGLKRLRDIAPSIHICFDACENEWQPFLLRYAEAGCFDLQVTIDGTQGAAVDMVTIAPVDPTLYDLPGPPRTIRCGFSGNIGLTPAVMFRGRPVRRRGYDPRGRLIEPLVHSGLVVMRERDVAGGAASYGDHVRFMQSCRIIINTSFTGSGLKHHVKQRVFETAYAGCALLETAGSPIDTWLPPACYIPYKDGYEAAMLIQTLPDDVIDHCAETRAAYVRSRYRPEMIYGEMLARAGVKCAAYS